MNVTTKLKQIFLSIIVLSVTACATTPQLVDVQSSMPQAGWRQHSAGNAEIWLPTYFVGGDIQRALPSILQTLEDLGPDYSGIVETIKQNKHVFKLFAVAQGSNGRPSPTNVIITEEKIPANANVNLDSLAQYFSRLPNAKLKSINKMFINGVEARKLIVIHKIQGLTMIQENYVLKANNSIWAITYTALDSDYTSMKPVFLNSISSFRVIGI